MLKKEKVKIFLSTKCKHRRLVSGATGFTRQSFRRKIHGERNSREIELQLRDGNCSKTRIFRDRGFVTAYHSDDDVEKAMYYRR